MRLVLILLCTKSAGRAGPSAGSAAQWHAYQRPSGFGRKEVDELYRFFRGFLVLDTIL